MRQDRNDAAAARVHVRELVRKRDLRNAVAVDVIRCEIDRIVDPGHEDMLLPARILVPPNLPHVARNDDDVRIAVTVQIGDDDLVPAGEACVNRMRSESCARRITGRQRRTGRQGRHHREDDGGGQSETRTFTERRHRECPVPG